MSARLELKSIFAKTDINSDAALILDAIIFDDHYTPGTRRSAVTLLQIAPQHRSEARLEGTRICNSVPGWRPSDALWEACRKYR